MKFSARAKSGDDTGAWRHYLALYRNKKLSVAAAVAAAVVQTGALLPIPLLVREAIDTAIPEERLALLLALGGAMLLSAIVSGVAAAVNKRLVLKIVTPTTRDVRLALVEKLYGVSRGFHTRSESGSLHDLVVHETVRIERMMITFLAEGLAAALLSSAIIVVLATINWQLALVLALLGPLMYVANFFLGRRVKRAARSYHKALERFSKGLLFVLRAMDLTRIQAAESSELERQHRRIDTLRQKAEHRKWLVAVYQATQRTIVAGAGVWVLVVGGGFVINESITIGELLSFYAAVALLQGPLRQLAARVPVVIEGQVSLQHLYTLLNEPDRRPYLGTKVIDFQGTISLQNVTFGYGAANVLEGVSLDLKPGRVTALIGLNGAGKTTVANLIHGFYRPRRGALYADGVPYDELDLVALRAQMGSVLQQPIIFTGTVRENIVYGVEDSSDDELAAALRAADAEYLIDALPEGLGTRVGEEGVLLSGGERQRLAIARALLGRPSLLILDEPTNHLDEVSMIHILDNIMKMRDRPAILVISHHKQVVALADETYMVEEGAITLTDGVSTLERWVHEHNHVGGIT